MRGFFKGFGYAFNGLGSFFAHERNGKVQLIVAVAAIAAGFYFHITAVEWCIILCCIAGVLSLEMINSAIEKMCDHITSERHPAIKAIKDISAGAVLWSAIIAAIIGVIVFGKYLLVLIKK